jgi:hypothetical protein
MAGLFRFHRPFSKGDPNDHSLDRGQQRAGRATHPLLGQGVSTQTCSAVASGPSLYPTEKCQ